MVYDQNADRIYITELFKPVDVVIIVRVTEPVILSFPYLLQRINDDESGIRMLLYKVFDLFHGILAEYGCIERVIVSSFNVTLLRRLKEAYSDFKTGYLYHPMIEKFMKSSAAPAPFELFPAAEAVKTALEQHCDAIHPPIDVLDQATVDDAHAHGLQVNVWTCNTLEQVRKSIALDVDGIITNYPDWVKFALEKA